MASQKTLLAVRRNKTDQKRVAQRLGWLAVGALAAVGALLWTYSGAGAEQRWVPSSAGALCRLGYPGCVPVEAVKNLLFIDIGRAGGSTIRKFIEEGRASAGNKALRSCDLAPAMADRVFCHSQDGQHHNVLERDNVCEAQKTSLAHLHSRSLFDQLNCTLATGHYDFSLADTLPEEGLRDTLVVLNLRDPLERAASAYNSLKSLDANLLCPGGNCMPLLNFTMEGRAGEHPLNKLTRFVAGDYCCYNTQTFNKQKRLSIALKNLQKRAGVVIVSEHMQESLQYLGHLVGFPTRRSVLIHENWTAQKQKFEEADFARTREALADDYVLYDAAVAQVKQQTALLVRQGVI